MEMYDHVIGDHILDKSRYEAERTSAGLLLKVLLVHSSKFCSADRFISGIKTCSNLFNKNPIFGIGKIDHQLSDKWHIKTDVTDKNNR